jgi:hypothetical protein
MAARYTAEAIDYCFKLYLKYNGQQHDRIEKEMHKRGWSGWRKKNLYSSKDGRGGETLGWIEKYGWEKALKEHLANKVAPSLDSAEKLVREIEEVRVSLATEIRSKGAPNVDKERLQLHRDYCGLSISALTKVEAARDTLSGWTSFFERFIDWAVDRDPKLARKLTDDSDYYIGRAAKEFGEESTATEEPGMNADANSAGPATDGRTKD